MPIVTVKINAMDKIDFDHLVKDQGLNCMPVQQALYDFVLNKFLKNKFKLELVNGELIVKE